MDWSNVIKTLEKQGLTLTEIASRVGLSVSALSDIKNRRSREPTGMVAVRLHSLWKRLPAAVRQAEAA